MGCVEACRQLASAQHTARGSNTDPEHHTPARVLHGFKHTTAAGGGDAAAAAAATKTTKKLHKLQVIASQAESAHAAVVVDVNVLDSGSDSEQCADADGAECGADGAPGKHRTQQAGAAAAAASSAPATPTTQAAGALGVWGLRSQVLQRRTAAAYTSCMCVQVCRAAASSSSHAACQP
jgi:hypothetical protein